MPRRGRQIARKTLRWTLWSVLGLVATLAICGALLLYSPGFLHAVINVGLGYYNDRIPGEIRIGRVEGRLADHLVLGDIYLEDAQGRVLVAVRELTLDWSPWDLLDGGLTVASLTLADAQLHLVAGEAFADLALPGPPAPPREAVAPSLPIDLRIARLEVTGVDVMADDGATIVGDLRLSARELGWFGRVAHLQIDDGAAQLPGLAIEAVTLTADYGEPHLQLAASIRTELGVVTIDRLDLDVAERRGEATIAGDGRREALAARLPAGLAEKLLLAADPTIRVHARGSLDALELGVHARLPGLAELDLAVSGDPLGAPRISLRGRAELDLAAVVPAPLGARLGVVRPGFSATIAGPDWSQLAGELRAHCGECGAASGLELHALATRDSRLDDVATYLRLTGLGVDLTAELRAGPLGPEAGRWDLHAPDIAEPLGVARLFVPLPPLAGGVRSQGSCTGAPLRCEGELVASSLVGAGASVGQLQVHVHGQPLAPVPDLHATISARGLRGWGQHFAGALLTVDVGERSGVAVDAAHTGGALELAAAAELWVRARDRGDRVKLALRVLPGASHTVLLDALDLRLRGLRAVLSRPARIVATGRRLDVHGLRLRAAGGALEVDGRLDRDGRSDLVAQLTRVHIAPLAALVPALRGQLAGRVTARATLSGPARAPAISLLLGGQQLRLRGGVLGDLDLVARLEHGRGRVALGLFGRTADELTASLELPVALDLSRGAFAVGPGDVHLAFDLTGLRLAALGPWVALPRPLHGRVDVHVAVDGPAAQPDTEVQVHGRGLRYGEDLPATLDLRFSQRAGADATARLELGRLAARVRLDVTKLPVRVDLVHGPVLWRPEAEHTATLVARDINLWRQLGALDPGRTVAGKLEIEGKFQGSMLAPDLSLALLGDGLRVRDGAIGQLRLDLRLRAQRAVLDLDLRGAVARHVSLHAEAPLRVALHRGEIAWLEDEAQIVDARVLGLDFAALKALGLSAAFTGSLDAQLRMRGPASAPVLHLSSDLHELVWKDRRVGSAHLDVDYAAQRVKVGLDAQLGSGTVKLRGSAPVRADLGRGRVTWDEHGAHDVELRVDGLDRTMLAPLGRVPEEALLGLSMIARVKGNLAAFTGDLQAHGQLGHKLIGGAPLHITAAIGPRAQQLRFTLGPHKWAGELDVRVDTRADILALVRGTAKAADIPFTASLRAPKFDARFAQAFVPKSLYDLNGELVAAVDARGTLAAPVVHGELHLRGGGITVLALQQRIRNVELDLRADGRTIVLESLTAESGLGRVSGSARLELAQRGGLTLGSTVVLQGFPVVRPGLPQMQVDTRLKIAVRASPEETDVDLELKGTTVRVTGYTVDPPKQIPVNAAVIVKGDRPREQAGSAGARAAGKFVVRVKLADPVEIRGPATDMRWSGAVLASREGELREVAGSFSAQAGRLDLLGNRFTIDAGEVTLPPDEDIIDPFIRVVAHTRTPMAEVTASLRGRLSRPTLVFTSLPVLTQSQILTLLLTGSPDANDADEQRVMAQAAALLATFESPQLASFLSSRVGIDHVGLGFGDDLSQPILSVGKRVSRKIYIETAYKVNAPARHNRVEARVEYQLAPRWTLETSFGDAAVGGLDVFWRAVFGVPKPRLEPTSPEVSPAPR